MTATATAADVAQLVDAYIAIWNETDSGARQALIARTWTEDGSYVDPLMEGDGHTGIDVMTAGAQAQFSGLQFRRTSEIDAHHNVARFTWELGPADGPGVAGGCDIATLAGGRLQRIVGFLDFMP